MKNSLKREGAKELYQGAEVVGQPEMGGADERADERGKTIQYFHARGLGSVPFGRYADDAIVRCRTAAAAQEVRAAIAARLQECRLELHPENTKVVYCKDDDRRGVFPHEKFDFLGYTFRPRRSKNRKGKYFINFSPAVSEKAGKAIRAEIRSSVQRLKEKRREIFRRGRGRNLGKLIAGELTPLLRGWMNYFRLAEGKGIFDEFDS